MSKQSRFSWRVTKFDPQHRDNRGVYLGDDWICVTEIGSVFEGKRLDVTAYLRVELAMSRPYSHS